MATMANSPETNTGGGPARDILTDGEWSMLLDQIDPEDEANEPLVTPILGRELTYGAIPSSSDIAEKLFKQYKCPIRYSEDLARVAQFLETVEFKKDERFARDKVSAIIKDAMKSPTPGSSSADEPHAILASLRLPLYVTTNYDTLMVKALRRALADQKAADLEYFRWNDFLSSRRSTFADGRALSRANPMVFHYFGHVEVSESLALTEDHYLDFLIETSKAAASLPRPGAGVAGLEHPAVPRSSAHRPGIPRCCAASRPI